MSLPSLSALSKYAKSAFPVGYPVEDHLTFYAPDDDLHAVLRDIVASATQSLVVAMYGFDDDEVAKMIMNKLNDPAIFVQLTMDSSQAAGKHEAELLKLLDLPHLGNTIAIGQSE